MTKGRIWKKQDKPLRSDSSNRNQSFLFYIESCLNSLFPKRYWKCVMRKKGILFLKLVSDCDHPFFCFFSLFSSFFSFGVLRGSFFTVFLASWDLAMILYVLVSIQFWNLDWIMTNIISLLRKNDELAERNDVQVIFIAQKAFECYR